MQSETNSFEAPFEAEPLDVAIMGFGGRGEGTFLDYVKKHPDDVRITAIVDPSENRQKRARELLGPQVSIYDSGSEFYAAEQAVDGIWILSQESSHADLAVPGLERGIPLITEKPLATTIEDAARIAEAHLQSPAIVSIPHVLRYVPGYRKLKEIVQSGKLGKIMHIHAAEQIDSFHTVYYYRRGPAMFRSNTFFLLAKCCHDIDIINWMMDSPARTVASFGGTDYFTPREDVPSRCNEGCSELEACQFSPRNLPSHIHELPRFDAYSGGIDANICAWNSPSEQVDHQTLILQYENGATADFTLRCFGDGRRPIQITGSDATAYFDVNSQELRVVHTNNLPGQQPIVEIFTAEDLPQAYEGPHHGGDWALLDDWVDAVRTSRPTDSASVYEAAEAVVVCVAADIAMRERRVVDIDKLRPLCIKNGIRSRDLVLNE